MKLSVMLSYPAVSVVVETNDSGSRVTHANRARPRLTISVVPTQSAMPASNWFAIPNIGQIVLMLPVKMKYDQPATTSKLEAMVRGSGHPVRLPHRLIELPQAL